ncbi:hypothetical protein Emed_003572 [Eimeria media]
MRTLSPLPHKNLCVAAALSRAFLSLCFRRLSLTLRRHIGLGASERHVSWASRGLLACNLPIHSSRAPCSARFRGGRTHELLSIRRSAAVSPAARSEDTCALTRSHHASCEIGLCVLLRTHALVDLPTAPSQHWRQLAQAGPAKGSCCFEGWGSATAEALMPLQAPVSCSREAEAMPPQRESRARDTSAAAAALSSSSSSNSSSGAARHEKGAIRGSSARGRSSEPSDAAEGSSSERAAAASRRNGGRSRHASADASSSSSSSSSKRRQSQDHNNRRSGGGVRSSSRMQQMGGSLDRRRSSSGSIHSNCSDEQEEEATCPLCMEALDETDRGLFPCECGYQASRLLLLMHP